MDTSVPDPSGRFPGLLLPRNRTARRWLIAVSLVVHVGAVGTYVVLGLWRVEKLQPERGPIEVVAARMLDPGTGGEPKPGRKPPPVKPPEVRRAVKGPVQPTDLKTHVASDATPATGASDSTGNDDTTGDDGDDTLPPGDGKCPAPPCKQDPPTTTKVEPPKKPTTKFVTPGSVEQFRTRGNTQIHPSEVTKTQILHEGKTLVVGRIKYCIDERGNVHSVSLVEPTGYAEYDQRLLAGVRGWGFRPYQVGGQPMPVCTAVSFRYMMKK